MAHRVVKALKSLGNLSPRRSEEKRVGLTKCGSGLRN